MIEKLINLKEEWNALLPKIDKLGTFVNSADFESLSPKDKAMCEWTLEIMRDYLNALSDIILASKRDDAFGSSLNSSKLGKFLGHSGD
jgi:hypothetical protein